MNHSEANESAAAAAYVMGDLSGPERDAFEMHYIDCPVCAEEVWTGTRMLAAGREALKSNVVPFPVRWFQTKAVAAMFAVVVGIQSYVILRPPPPVFQMATVGPILTGANRAGEAIEPVEFVDGLQTAVGIEIPLDRPYPNYRIEVRDSSEKVLMKVEASAKQVRSQQSISLLLSPLPVGRYAVVVEGVREDGNRFWVITQSFVVE
ncbi:MAG: zf-HC2 domain-containing protein [Acidobacteriota bacterium]|nr:zf-HC2 domain-containing protein [Acidobacteriota bacterium]